MAKYVWALLDEELVEHMIAINVDNERLWLAKLQTTTKKEDYVKALVALWAVWWVRKRAIHEQEFQSPLSTLCFINNYLAELALIPKKREKVHHGARSAH